MSLALKIFHRKMALLINIMLVGPAMLTQTLPGMRERIMAVLSMWVLSTLCGLLSNLHILAKHGLIGLAKTVALEMAIKTLPLILCAQHTSKRHW